MKERTGEKVKGITGSETGKRERGVSEGSFVPVKKLREGVKRK